MEPIHLKAAGAKWWFSDDYASPSLSKASLGDFFYNVLKVGGYIGEVWPFNTNYIRSAVYISVYMTDIMKEEVEKNTKFRFHPPPTISVN